MAQLLERRLDQCCCEKRSMELTKKVANPRCISYSIRNHAVFSLSTRRRQRVLAFGRPRQEVVTKKNTVDGGGGGVGVVCGDDDGGDDGGGGVGVLCGDGVDDGVRGVVCEAPISTMIVSVHEKDRWCGTRGKFVLWKGVRVTKASKHAKVDVIGSYDPDSISDLDLAKMKNNPRIRMSSGAPDFPTRANLSNTGEDQPHAYLNSDDHERRPQSLSSVAHDRIVISDVTGDRVYAIADGLSVNQAPGFDGVGAPRNISLIDDSSANTSDNTTAALTLSQIRPAVYSQDTDQASDMDNRLNYAGKSVNGRRQKNVTVKVRYA
nr:hypothetical protein [Tanacetum cinerariifolium]